MGDQHNLFQARRSARQKQTRGSFLKKEPKNFCAAVADYPATAAQKFLLLFSKRSASFLTRFGAMISM
jgi:hypothetical protein